MKSNQSNQNSSNLLCRRGQYDDVKFSAKKDVYLILSLCRSFDCHCCCPTRGRAGQDQLLCGVSLSGLYRFVSRSHEISCQRSTSSALIINYYNFFFVFFSFTSSFSFFLMHYSHTLMYSQVGDIFTLTYIPWGNAHLLSDGTFQCQHGQMECLINTVDACVLHYYPNR